MRYDDLVAEVRTCPATWIPALLVAVVQRAARDRVFQEGGLQRTVERALSEVAAPSTERPRMPHGTGEPGDSTPRVTTIGQEMIETHTGESTVSQAGHRSAAPLVLEAAMYRVERIINYRVGEGDCWGVMLGDRLLATVPFLRRGDADYIVFLLNRAGRVE